MKRSSSKRARSGGHTEGGSGHGSGAKKRARSPISAGAAVGLGGAPRPPTQKSEQAAPCYYYQMVQQADGKPEWSPAQLKSLNMAKATEERKFLGELTSHHARHGEPGWEPIPVLEREGWWKAEAAGAHMEQGCGQTLAGWRDPPSLEDTLQGVDDSRGGGCVYIFGSLTHNFRLSQTP